MQYSIDKIADAYRTALYEFHKEGNLASKSPRKRVLTMMDALRRKQLGMPSKVPKAGPSWAGASPR